MSVIYTQWVCQDCKSEFRYYVSFGEPVEDFDYKWKCKKCGHVNTLHVKAFNPLTRNLRLEKRQNDGGTKE